MNRPFNGVIDRSVFNFNNLNAQKNSQARFLLKSLPYLSYFSIGGLSFEGFAFPDHILSWSELPDRKPCQIRSKQRTGDRGRRTEDRGRRTEDRGRRTEDRGRKAEEECAPALMSRKAPAPARRRCRFRASGGDDKGRPSPSGPRGSPAQLCAPGR